MDLSKIMVKTNLTFVLLSISMVSCKIDKPKADLTIKDKVELVKSLTEETDKDQENEEWIDNLYRNKKYKFRVEFPKEKITEVGLGDEFNEWKYLPGAGKHILAKANNNQFGITISILVQNLPMISNFPNDIWQNSSMMEIEQKFKELSQLQNIEGFNYQIAKGALHNFNAYIISFNSIARSGDKTLEYFNQNIQCNVANKIYQIAITTPSYFWEFEQVQSMFGKVVDSYKFEIAF